MSARRALRRVALAFVALVIAMIAGPSFAGELNKAGIERVFPAPLVVGERDPDLAIWPILKQEAGSYEVFAYAFESADFAPIPGFGGSAPDLLIAMAPDGTFRDLKVLSQHEPVFVDGYGPEPLFAFVQQYVGMSAKRSIRVGRNNARSAGASNATVVDGIAMATASTRVINEEILESALAVARKKLGFGAATNLGLKVIAKDDEFTAMSWDALLAKGWVKDFHLTNKTVNAAFADTDVSDQTEGKPDAAFADTYIAYVNVPSIGRNLLGEKLYNYVMGSLAPGDHAIMVLAHGPWDPIGEDFTFGAIPDRIAVLQDKFSIPARDLAIERGDGGMKGMPSGDWSILKISDEAGFNPSKRWDLQLKVTREQGQILAQKYPRDFTDAYSLPADLFVVRKAEGAPSWTDSWVTRKWTMIGIGAMLLVLVPVLIRQKGLVAQPRRFQGFRLVYLTVTLGFVGWYAQAQLSIVTLMGLVRTAATTRDFSFLLYDPPSLVLWAFVLLTLVVWGRGTFCGWLCPFGAMQELVAAPARWLKIPQVEVPRRLDQALRLVKYVVLAGILVSAAFSPKLADNLVEVEPFKTSITLYFIRFWPFVAYAVGLLILNLFVYKGFCRYLCPLGASLAVVGRLRIFDWIPRRVECGTPCQLCKVKCRYGAIESSGKIDYPECFQCMDCVTIIHDPQQCVPQILERKRNRTIHPEPVPAE